MALTFTQDILAIASGSLVGFALGLLGAGGSILAVPLLVYVVGVKSPHVAIGTSSVAVALSALSSLAGHVRAGNVRWPCAALFAVSGVIGAMIGSTAGKRFDGQRLLVLFGLLMMGVAMSMLLRRSADGAKYIPLSKSNATELAPRLAGYGVGTGMLAGFFGIGGGFLVVPGLIAAADLPMLAAVGSSLVSVSAFGLTTAANYAASGLVDWTLVGLFVLGGSGGSVAGSRLASRLASQKATLSRAFAGLVAVVGAYVVLRGTVG